MIAKRWKAVDPEYKKELEEVSRTDYVRYDNEMKEWNEQGAKDEQRDQEVDSDSVLKIDELEVKSKRLEDQGTTLIRRNEKLTGLSEDKSDQLEDVADDDAFAKEIIALLTPQEQGQNVVATHDVHTEISNDLFCIEPCTSVYTNVADADADATPNGFSLNPMAASSEHSNSMFINLDESSLQTSDLGCHSSTLPRDQKKHHCNESKCYGIPMQFKWTAFCIQSKQSSYG
jgi:hypothetical protein